jgi:hypothetical protein
MMAAHFTGHALIDVGLAGLCAFARREGPEQLTVGDLDAAGRFRGEHYRVPHR